MLGGGLLATKVVHSDAAGLWRRMVWVRRLWRLGLVFCIVWSVLVFLSTKSAYDEARAMLISGSEQMLEGTVDSVVADGNRENVIVGATSFVVAESLVRPGYNLTTRRGGMLRKGARVRIHYFKGRILRLEVRE